MKKNLVEEFKEFCRDKYKYNLKNLDEIIEMYQEFEKSRAPTEVKSDIKELSRYKMHFSENSNFLLITGQESRCGSIKNPGIMHGVGAHPEAVDYMFERQWDLIPVYEVEWLETDNNFIMNRYNTIRIGQDIYILRGKDDKVIRSKDNPNYCGLTVNGVYFLNRNQEPYSLILKCAHLQD